MMGSDDDDDEFVLIIFYLQLINSGHADSSMAGKKPSNLSS